MSKSVHFYQGFKGLPAISKHVGIHKETLSYRIYVKKMTLVDAIGLGPGKEPFKYEYRGYFGLRTIAAAFNFSHKTLESRVIGKGMSIEEALSKPVQRKTFKCKNGKRKEIKIVKPEQKNKLWNLALGMGGC